MFAVRTRLTVHGSNFWQNSPPCSALVPERVPGCCGKIGQPAAMSTVLQSHSEHVNDAKSLKMKSALLQGTSFAAKQQGSGRFLLCVSMLHDSAQHC